MTDNNQEDYEECCLEQRISCIKYGIIAQIFAAGMSLKEYDAKFRDKNGELSPEKVEELQERIETSLDIYNDVVDLIWERSAEIESDVCDGCREDDDSELDEELKNKLKNINPN